MISFEQFINLDQLSREIIFQKYGVLVANRTDYNCIYNLYQLFSFYLEAQYLLPSHTLISLNIFENTDNLDPYLRELSITFMF